MSDFSGDDNDAIAVALAELALMAGPSVMEEYARSGDVREKRDGSPVTRADERAEAIIVEQLRSLAPAIPIVAEEEVAAGGQIECGQRFFLVDPLDGTREFIAKNGEFTINIALIQGSSPIAGAVYAPAINRLWFAGRTAFGVSLRSGEPLPELGVCERLRARAAPALITAVASRSHGDPDTEAFLSTLNIGERISCGSSLKFCVVAEGRADVYPRFAPTMEWDTAAGDAILRAAGGCVLQRDGRPLKYGKLSDSLRNSAFVGWGDPRMASLFVKKI